MAELEWRGIEWKFIDSFIDRCFFLPLTYFSRVIFPRNLAQTFRSDRSTYLKNIFFYSFYTFEVMTHFVAEESFLDKYLNTLFGCNSRGLNTVAFFSVDRVLTFKFLRKISNFHLLDNELWKSFHLKAMQQKCLQNKKYLYYRDSLELFLECQFSLISLSLLLYGTLAILFSKLKVKLRKPSSCWYMHNRQSKNSWYLPLQILAENT